MIFDQKPDKSIGAAGVLYKCYPANKSRDINFISRGNPVRLPFAYYFLRDHYQYCNKYLRSRLLLKYLILAVNDYTRFIETNWSIKPHKWSLVSVASTK